MMVWVVVVVVVVVVGASKVEVWQGCSRRLAGRKRRVSGAEEEERVGMRLRMTGAFSLVCLVSEKA